MSSFTVTHLKSNQISGNVTSIWEKMKLIVKAGLQIQLIYDSAEL